MRIRTKRSIQSVGELNVGGKLTVGGKHVAHSSLLEYYKLYYTPELLIFCDASSNISELRLEQMYMCGLWHYRRT